MTKSQKSPKVTKRQSQSLIQIPNPNHRSKSQIPIPNPNVQFSIPNPIPQFQSQTQIPNINSRSNPQSPIQTNKGSFLYCLYCLPLRLVSWDPTEVLLVVSSWRDSVMEQLPAQHINKQTLIVTNYVLELSHEDQ